MSCRQAGNAGARPLNNMARCVQGRLVSALACLLAGGALLAGCGGGSGSTTSSGPGTAESRPAPPKSDFPSARGKTLADVLNSADGPSDLVVSPAAMVFYKGENRYPFGVFNRDRTQVPDAQVALYFAKVPPAPKGGAAKRAPKQGAGQPTVAKALDQPAVGPFPAAIESLDDPARVPCQDDDRRSRRRHRRLQHQHRLPQQRRVADRRR